MNKIRFQAALCAAILLSCGVAAAQTAGTITGTLTDQSGAVMPGVKVIATLKGPGEVREVTTNSAGQYSLPFLAPGNYQLSFQAQGFATMIEKATLNVTESIAVNVVMQPVIGVAVSKSKSPRPAKPCKPRRPRPAAWWTTSPSGNCLSPAVTSRNF